MIMIIEIFTLFQYFQLTLILKKEVPKRAHFESISESGKQIFNENIIYTSIIVNKNYTLRKLFTA